MFNDPVIEQFRLNGDEDGYSGVFTLAYPSKSICIALGFTSSVSLKVSQFKQLIKHAKKNGRKELVFYRERNGKEIIKVIKL